eukprot:907585-Prymnesium_polylepis.1
MQGHGKQAASHAMRSHEITHVPSRIACDAAARARAHGATPDGEHDGATCGGRTRAHAAIRAIRTSRASRVACHMSPVRAYHVVESVGQNSKVAGA